MLMGLIYCECSMAKVWLDCKVEKFNVIALHLDVSSIAYFLRKSTACFDVVT